MNRPLATASGLGERTSRDLSSLLVELSRALKGLHFYDAAAPAYRDVLDRVYLAWRVELERAGPIELDLQGEAIRCAGVPEPVTPEHRLRDQLLAHEIERLRVTPDLSREAFAAFLELFGANREPRGGPGDFGDALASHPASADGSISVNDSDPLPATPPRIDETDDGDDDPAALDFDPPLEDVAAGEKPSLDEAPLDAPANDAEGERLRLCLRRLDQVIDDDHYASLADQATKLACRLADDGAIDEGYRTIRVLCDHASGQGGRSAAQLRTAQTVFDCFTVGQRLDELIARAGSATGTAGVRAAQVLLAIGQRAIAPLLEALEGSRDTNQAAQLAAIVVALGERAEPVLGETILHGPIACARHAVQLAGELQSPRMVDALVDALQGGRHELARDAARALAVTGSRRAIDALVETLDSRRPGLPEVAVHCLGALRSPDTVDALLATLDRALRKGHEELARACIRALGQIGSERATPKLVAIVERKGFLQRKRQRALKMTALSALAQLPCNEARRAIERARRNRDRELRDHAGALTSR